MLLYAFLWFPNLNKTATRFSQDIVVSILLSVLLDSEAKVIVEDEVQFPAIALFQNSNWTSQANISPKSMKCFLGWHKEDAVLCDDLPPEKLIPGHSCNCKAGWTNDVIEGFRWQNTTYRYLSWRPTPKLIDRVPTFLMTLQAFFTCAFDFSLCLPRPIPQHPRALSDDIRLPTFLQIMHLNPSPTRAQPNHQVFGLPSMIRN